jgi:hypothetical protein
MRAVPHPHQLGVNVEGAQGERNEHLEHLPNPLYVKVLILFFFWERSQGAHFSLPEHLPLGLSTFLPWPPALVCVAPAAARPITRGGLCRA